MNATTYLCIPELGLANLSIQLGQIEASDLGAGSLYAPPELLQD